MKYLVNGNTNILYKNMARLAAFSIALIIYIVGFSGAVLAQPINIAVTTTVSGENKARFTATENGATKENVNIYIDGLLSGQTGSNGTYVVSGLTAGSHAWDAEYGGGYVGTGKFVFFGYDILATGTSSPSLDFNYTITANGTEFRYEDQERVAEVEVNGWYESEEFRAWFHIDHTQTVRLKYYYEPGHASWCDGGERCVNPWVGEYQTLTPGDWYIYAKTWNQAWNNAYSKVHIWFKSRTDIPWSATESGSGSVNATDGSKYITTSTLTAPNGNTIWTVDHDNPHLFTQMSGNRLFANTKYTDAWSQTESGIGSVTDNDFGKLIATSSVEAPNNDTHYSLDIILDGVLVRDQDGNDLNKVLDAIEYEGVIAWTQGKELHASMS